MADPAAQVPEAPKDLTRFRERLADWNAGKGGWSKRAGKILSTEPSAMVTPDGGVVRRVQDGEALRTGALLSAATNQPVIFQSGAGILHRLAPGAVVRIDPLTPEKDEPYNDANMNGVWDQGETFTDTNKNGIRDLAATEVDLELIRGRLDTWIPDLLAPPRRSLIRLGNGDATRVESGCFTIRREEGQPATVSCLEGTVLISRQEGGMLQASVPAGTMLVAGETKVEPLPTDGGLAREFTEFRKETRTQILLDACEDAVARLDAAHIGEVVQAAKLNLGDRFRETAAEMAAIRPDLLGAIKTAGGLADLALSKAAEAKAAALKMIGERFDLIRQTGVDPYAKLGQVIGVDGVVKMEGQPVKKDQVLPQGARIVTSGKARVRVVVAPGAYASIEPNSDVILQEMKAEIADGKLVKRSAILKNDAGLVLLHIKEWDKDKTDIRVVTQFGQARAMGTVYGTANDGSQMTVTTTKGSVQTLSVDGQNIAVNSGTQASVPGSGQAGPIQPNNPVAGMLASFSSSLPTTQQVLAAAVADAKTNPTFAAAADDAGDARAGGSTVDTLITSSDGLADSLASVDTAAGGDAAGTSTAAGGGGGGGGGGGAVSAGAGGGAGAAVAGLNPTRPQSPSSP